jgi:hypothetical protein
LPQVPETAQDIGRLAAEREASRCADGIASPQQVSGAGASSWRNAT